jgi:thioredoxin-related protein
MSGLAPPASYTFFLSPNEADKSIKDKYPSYTMCANNIPCFKDYYEGMNYAKEVNKMPFLDFTGHGCVNCRKVEEHIWVKDEIRDKLIEDCVLISLYVDDDKKYEDVKISVRIDSTYKIRNVGNKWSDFQQSNFKQNTQPLYVMLTLDEEVIANPRGYRPNEGVQEYNEYMECGLKTFADNQ